MTGKMTIYASGRKHPSVRVAAFRFRNRTQSGPEPNPSGTGTHPEPKAVTGVRNRNDTERGTKPESEPDLNCTRTKSGPGPATTPRPDCLLSQYPVHTSETLENLRKMKVLCNGGVSWLPPSLSGTETETGIGNMTMT